MNAIIIPTGRRLVQFGTRLMQYLANQKEVAEKYVLIVVVDIANEYEAHYNHVAELAQNTSYISDFFVALSPVRWRPTINTQSSNLTHGLNVLDQCGKDIKNLFIIEDDDYYSPLYLHEMEKALHHHTYVGASHTLYYHVGLKQFKRHNNQHGSLFQVAFNYRLHKADFVAAFGQKFIDIKFAERLKRRRVQMYLLPETPTLSVGIKGLLGKAGIGGGHKSQNYYSNTYKNDELLMLMKLLYE